jgi:hypothetical protein
MSAPENQTWRGPEQRCARAQPPCAAAHRARGRLCARRSPLRLSTGPAYVLLIAATHSPGSHLLDDVANDARGDDSRGHTTAMCWPHGQYRRTPTSGRCSPPMGEVAVGLRLWLRTHSGIGAFASSTSNPLLQDRRYGSTATSAAIHRPAQTPQTCTSAHLCQFTAWRSTADFEALGSTRRGPETDLCACTGHTVQRGLTAEPGKSHLRFTGHSSRVASGSPLRDVIVSSCPQAEQRSAGMSVSRSVREETGMKFGSVGIGSPQRGQSTVLVTA